MKLQIFKEDIISMLKEKYQTDKVYFADDSFYDDYFYEVELVEKGVLK